LSSSIRSWAEAASARLPVVRSPALAPGDSLPPAVTLTAPTVPRPPSRAEPPTVVVLVVPIAPWTRSRPASTAIVPTKLLFRPSMMSWPSPVLLIRPSPAIPSSVPSMMKLLGSFTSIVTDPEPCRNSILPCALPAVAPPPAGPPAAPPVTL
jgi:hypothetical protein